MERKVGEVFEYQGKKLRVEESKNGGCDGCFFDGQTLSFCNKLTLAGHCEFEYRTDKKEVIFVEITEEQLQEQPQELNLCEILKYCPEGEIFWSPMLGDVKFYDINQNRKFVNVNLESGETWNFNSNGTISFGGATTSPEIMLYPSKEQRDWSKFTAPWLKKERFDPKTFKAFDKVLARLNKQGIWCCELFSFIEDDTNLIKCCGAYYQYCIPYNDDTKHLVGTTDEAPEFYRYW